MAADMRRPRREGAGSTLPELEGGPIVTCSLDGCDRPVKARGYCGACYQRLWKAGSLPERRLKRDGRPHTCRQHGPSRACYSGHTCRCDGCREANRVYENDSNMRRARGVEAMVDAEPVRRHVERLSMAGLGKVRLSEISGMSVGSILKLKRQSKQMLKANADAIMAVEEWQALRDPKRLAQIGRNERCVTCAGEPLFGGLRCLRCFQEAALLRKGGPHVCVKHAPSLSCYNSCRCRCAACRKLVNDSRAEYRRRAAS